MQCWVRYTDFVLDAKTEFDCASVHRKNECKVYPKDTVGVVSSSIIQIVRLSYCTQLRTGNRPLPIEQSESGVCIMYLHNMTSSHNKTARPRIISPFRSQQYYRRKRMRSNPQIFSACTAALASHSQNPHQHYCSYACQLHCVSDIEQFVRRRTASMTVFERTR